MAGKASRYEQAIAALLSEPTVEAAAGQAGISYRTLKLWLARPEFQAAYRAARAELLERTVARLLRACDRAVGRLERNLDAETVQGSNRAAALILATAVKGVEALDLRAEVEALKRIVAEMKRGRGNGDQRAAGTGAAEGPVEDGAAEADPGGPDDEPDEAGAGP